MSATHPTMPPVVPMSLRQWAEEFVRRSYIERLKRAGWPSCGLCEHRNPPGSDICERCHAPQESEPLL